MTSMLVVADVAAGPVVLLFGLVAGLMAFVPIVLIEALLLWLLKWGSFRRSLRDSAVVNLVTTLLGIVIGLVFFPWYDWSPAIFGVLAWALSIIVEGWLLGLLERYEPRRTWSAAVVINTVSYLLLGGFFYLTAVP